jgi:hypothetical protein
MNHNITNNTCISHDKKTAFDRLTVLFGQPASSQKAGSFSWQNSDAKANLRLSSDRNTPCCYELELRLHGRNSQDLEPYITVIWSLIGGDMKDALTRLGEIWRGAVIDKPIAAPGWSAVVAREGACALISLKREATVDMDDPSK